MKKYQNYFLSENFQFLEVNFSIYLRIQYLKAYSKYIFGMQTEKPLHLKNMTARFSVT